MLRSVALNLCICFALAGVHYVALVFRDGKRSKIYRESASKRNLVW